MLMISLTIVNSMAFSWKMTNFRVKKCVYFPSPKKEVT